MKDSIQPGLGAVAKARANRRSFLKKSMAAGGNCPDVTIADGVNDVVFDIMSNPKFNTEEFKPNLIMPEPTEFLKANFPAVSIVRPTETKNAAMGAVKFLTAEICSSASPPTFSPCSRTWLPTPTPLAATVDLLSSPASPHNLFRPRYEARQPH